jgi:Flp pilus assembly pilin Flp
MNRQNKVPRLPAISRAISRGQTMTEYAMILATIAAVTVALVTNAGTIVSTLVGKVSALL